jgi:hypothetical protein
MYAYSYADFVIISKEISTLENDMLELKASLQEWKNMPNLLTLDQSTSTGDTSSAADARRRTARSSIADLRTLYVSQLQTLHSSIEGSATFVPAIPGRHIIAEASDLQQLNAATYRPEHGAHIVLLDDSLLVARRRRGRLVADRSWALGEVSLVDVRDTSELQNVFKIKRGQDTFVYRTERLPDKRTLLGQFRQAAEELAKKKRKEREGEHERRRSMWNAGDVSLEAPYQLTANTDLLNCSGSRWDQMRCLPCPLGCWTWRRALGLPRQKLNRIHNGSTTLVMT